MKSPSYRSCLLSKTGNPNPSIPWSRFRHGCGPADDQRQWNIYCPTCLSDSVSSSKHDPFAVIKRLTEQC